VLFQRDVAIFNVLDPSRLFTTKLNKTEPFSLHFTDSDKNKETPLEVQFERGQKVQFFDIETLGLEEHAEKAKTMQDQLWALYYKNYLKTDFGYVKKGIAVDRKSGEGPELMFLGEVAFSEQAKRFIMNKPKLVIGTDRLELYEFMARRREVLLGHNRTWLKIAFGATLLHGLFVQVPTLFSRFFGDEVTGIEKRIGAEDQSEMGLKMSRMKQNTQRKELL